MDLLKRVISGAVMIALLVALVLLGGWVLAAGCAVIAFLMMWDVTGALKNGGYRINRPVLLGTAALLLPTVYFFKVPGLLMLTMLSFTVLSACTILSKDPDFKGLFVSFLALIYPLLPAALLVHLAVTDLFFESGDPGMAMIVSAVICACLSDMLAYFGGRAFGKKKLCPLISPKKTVAGSVASFIGGALAGVILSFLPFVTILKVSRILWIVIGVACGGLAQIGDLVASMLKRVCGVKDYGHYIPGHGGMMDRMDSISTCLFAIVILVQLFSLRIL